MSDDDALLLALRVIGQQQAYIRDVNSSLYQAEVNLAEQERLTEAARRMAVSLESDVEQARDELRQVAEDMRL
jgi:multidrug resistance efflux pump